MQHTRYPFTTIAVADDGSDDGTMEMLRGRGVLAVTGANRGVAWNKNRVLFLLTELLRCDVVILLEDDSYPTVDGWELEWTNAAIRWGHANLAGEWLRESFLSGAGTLEDPLLATRMAANCASFSREALLFGGYFDPRFHGYGHGHVEHTVRLGRAGYGAISSTEPDGARRMGFYLLWSSIAIETAPTAFNNEDAARNLELAVRLMDDRAYRAPWRDEAEMRAFRDELRAVSPRVL